MLQAATVHIFIVQNSSPNQKEDWLHTEIVWKAYRQKNPSDFKAKTVYGTIKIPPFIFLEVSILSGLCLFCWQIIKLFDIYVSLQSVRGDTL